MSWFYLIMLFLVFYFFYVFKKTFSFGVMDKGNGLSIDYKFPKNLMIDPKRFGHHQWRWGKYYVAWNTRPRK